MTNKTIEQKKQELYSILKKGCTKEVMNELRDLANSINAPIPASYNDGHDMERINDITRNIHITLQTEEMFNACVFAKWSCFWAAIAAIAACISVVLVLFFG